ncbi:rCG32960 [Rattus norvegicus]|uniref:RCG32960 n=1 Tax=Rattus norvegicus TaxID=10116 RepID=A6HJ63_RAT|nr:rCG32960 [Rattus norvegicus]
MCIVQRDKFHNAIVIQGLGSNSFPFFTKRQSLCSLGWPGTKKSTCLCLTSLHYHTQPRSRF